MKFYLPSPQQYRVLSGCGFLLLIPMLIFLLLLYGVLLNLPALMDSIEEHSAGTIVQSQLLELHSQEDYNLLLPALKAQAFRARENLAINAQMRAAAQIEVTLEIEVSEAYRQWQEHLLG